MMRLLHILAITGLIGSAAYAYTIKYETLFYSEELVKLRVKLAKERDGIAVAKAEWALLTRPDRLQKMASQHLDLQPIAIAQLARLSDLPARPDRGDEIGRKLEMLGLDPVAAAPRPSTSKAAASGATGPATTGSIGTGSKPLAFKPAAVTARPAAATPRPAAAMPSGAAAPTSLAAKLKELDDERSPVEARRPAAAPRLPAR